MQVDTLTVTLGARGGGQAVLGGGPGEPLGYGGGAPPGYRQDGGGVSAGAGGQESLPHAGGTGGWGERARPALAGRVAFEESCAALGIQLFVLPPRRPKRNGQVERLQRTFRDEFYTRPLPTGIPAIQGELEGYLAYYNRHRPHMALGGLAPLEFLAMLEGSVPPVSQMG